VCPSILPATKAGQEEKKPHHHELEEEEAGLIAEINRGPLLPNSDCFRSGLENRSPTPKLTGKIVGKPTTSPRNYYGASPLPPPAAMLIGEREGWLFFLVFVWSFQVGGFCPFSCFGF
jgi:hypothetical protein